MLTGRDYAGYLRQIGGVEKAMADGYAECLSLAANEDLKRIFAGLVKQEESHAELVRELAKLFDVPV